MMREAARFEVVRIVKAVGSREQHRASADKFGMPFTVDLAEAGKAGINALGAGILAAEVPTSSQPDCRPKPRGPVIHGHFHRAMADRRERYYSFRERMRGHGPSCCDGNFRQGCGNRIVLGS